MSDDITNNESDRAAIERLRKKEADLANLTSNYKSKTYYVFDEVIPFVFQNETAMDLARSYMHAQQFVIVFTQAYEDINHMFSILGDAASKYPQQLKEAGQDATQQIILGVQTALHQQVSPDVDGSLSNLLSDHSEKLIVEADNVIEAKGKTLEAQEYSLSQSLVVIEGILGKVDQESKDLGEKVALAGEIETLKSTIVNLNVVLEKRDVEIKSLKAENASKKRELDKRDTRSIWDRIVSKFTS